MSEHEVNKDLTDADRQALRDELRDRELMGKVMVLAIKVHEEGQLYGVQEMHDHPVTEPEPSITQRVKAIFEAAREVRDGK